MSSGTHFRSSLISFSNQPYMNFRPDYRSSSLPDPSFLGNLAFQALKIHVPVPWKLLQLANQVYIHIIFISPNPVWQNDSFLSECVKWCNKFSFCSGDCTVCNNTSTTRSWWEIHFGDRQFFAIFPSTIFPSAAPPLCILGIETFHSSWL